MAGDFEVHGGDQFFALSKALKNAGRVELRKQLNKDLKAAAKPLIKKTRSEALSVLPARGGLNRLVAKEPQRVQVRTGSKTAGVRLIVGRKRGAARSANQGKIRHPVFGHRDRWVDQTVPAGWFTDTVERDAPRIRRELLEAMERVAAEVVRDVKKAQD